MAALLILGVGLPATATAKPKKKADLVVSSVDAQSATDGETLLVTHRVRNRGARKAPASRTKFFLSETRVVSGSAEELAPAAAVPALKPKRSSTRGAPLQVPASTRSGSYFVIACADATKKVREKSERNNCKPSSQVTLPPRAPALNAPPSPSNANFFTLTGTAEPGSTIALYEGDGCQSDAGQSAPVDDNGDFELTDILVDPDSETTFTARTVGASGTLSDCSAPVTYVEDSTVEPPANLATTPASTGIDQTPTVTGDAEPGSTVFVFRNANCSGTAAAIGSTADGTFGIDVSVAKEFTTSLSAIQLDEAGNESDCSAATSYTQADAESEPNDAPGQADEIMEFPAKLQAAISPVDDQDWYAVEVTAGKPTVVAETRGANGAACGTTVETIVELYAPDGTTLLAQDDDDGDGNCSLIDGRGPDNLAANLAPGRYFVSVRYLGNSGTTPYQLTVDNLPAETEPNGTSGAANALSGDPGRVGGAISPVGDNDFYAVTVTADEPVLVAETSTPTCEGGGDTNLELFAPDGTTLLAENGDGGEGACSRIDGRGSDQGASNLAPGTYYVKVRTFGNLTSTPYTLEVETLAPESEPNNDVQGATPLATPSSVGGQISPIGDNDLFAVTVTADKPVLVAETSTPTCSTGSGGANDPDTILELFAPDGTTSLAFDDDSGEGACSRIDGRGSNQGASNLAPGTYYVRVRTFGNQTATPYTLRVSTVR